MKTKNLFIAGVLALALAACGGQPAAPSYVIQGESIDVQEGMIYLKCYLNGAFVDIDSTAIEGGKFAFTGSAKEPLAYGLTTVKSKRWPLTFFIGNETVQVKIDESAKSIQVTGSEFSELRAKLDGQLVSKTLTPESLLEQASASPVGAYTFLINFSSRLGYDELKDARAKFDASLEGSEYINQIDAYIAKLANLQNGAEAPDFSLPDADGNPVSLSSFRGKYVLVDFWASWCPDCRKENPNVVAAYKKFCKKNFTVLGVSLDKAKEPWLAAIEKDGLTWSHVCDYGYWDGPVVKLYAIRWIPRNFLIDPEGKIVASGLEGQDLLDKLAEVLK